MIPKQLLFLFALLLVSCGGSPSPTANDTSQAEPTAAIAIQPTVANAPAPANTPLTEATSESLPTEAVASAEPTAEPTATMLPQATESAGISAGLTTDNIFYLGNPNAPVTVTDFSDFL